EWLPTKSFGMRSIPIISSREPLWDQPGLAADVEAGRYYLSGTPTGRRSTLVTSAVEAGPQYLLELPGPSWLPLIAALGTAGFFLLLTFKMEVLALVFGIVALAMIWQWLWDADNGSPHPAVDIGGGICLPVSCQGRTSHSWWAVVMLLM